MSAPAAAALPPIPPNIAALAGPPLIGILLNWGLYGALTVQVYIYSQYFSEDRKLIKYLVYGLYCLETAQTALSTGDAVRWFASGFGNMIDLSKPFFSAIDAPIMDGIIAFAVQLFFCWRIWVLGKSWPFSVAIALVSTAQLVGGLASGIRTLQIGNTTELRSITPFLVTWFAGAALADTLIALAMTFLLTRNTSGFQGGDILRRIVRLTIETNTVTAVVAIVGFVSFVALPTTSIFMAPSYALGKLYSNTLMVVFNNRIILQQKTSGRNNTSGSRSDEIQSQSRRMQQNISIPRGQPVAAAGDKFKIEIFRETEVDRDDMQLEEYGHTNKRHHDASFAV